jgi:hypothetical protein
LPQEDGEAAEVLVSEALPHDEDDEGGCVEGRPDGGGTLGPLDCLF